MNNKNVNSSTIRRSDSSCSALQHIALAAIIVGCALFPPLLLAQSFEVIQSRFAGDEAGDWGGKNLAVIGPPDGTCANMGAVGKVNLIHNFGFDLAEDVLEITAVKFRAKAAAKAGQFVDIQVCPDITQLNGDDNCVGALETLSNVPVNVGGSGNCANTSLTEYVDLDHSVLTQQILEDHDFGLSFRKIETSEVKVDAVCLEVHYTTTDGAEESLACFDAPTPQTVLTLQKNVSGGSAVATAWDLTATGPTAGVTGKTGDAAITNRMVDPGQYVLTESAVTDYLPAATDPITCSCTIAECGGSFDNNDTLTLEEGDQFNCTFFNEAVPDVPATLTLIKEVINNDGGNAGVNDWLLSATGPFFFEGTSGVSRNDLPEGTYTLDEASDQSGYTLTSLVCTGDFVTQDDDEVTLAEGDDATCTFTNNDITPPPERESPPPPTAIPTLSQWALILMAMLILGAGLLARRGQHRKR